MPTPWKHPAVHILWSMIDIYINKRVSRASAQLAYYLLMSIFPILIVISSILSMLPITDSQVIQRVLPLLPPVIQQLLGDYLVYIESHQSVALLSGGAIMTLTASSAAFRGLMDIFGEVFGRRVREGFFGFIFSLFLSLLLVVMFYGGLLIVLLGNWIQHLLPALMDLLVIHYGWRLVQFLLPFAIIFLFLALIYRLTAWTPRHKRTILPGASLASVALVAATNVFSYFIGVSSRYTTVYGSLAAVIILLVWLFLCSNIIILGNIFNFAVAEQEDHYGTFRLPQLPRMPWKKNSK